MSKARIRTILMVASALFLLASASQVSTANADTRTTTKKSKVHKKQGEGSPVIVQVPPRVPVKVIAEDGRWVKVRYKGRTGWMTRTSLTATRKARSKERTRRRRAFVEGRSKKRGWSSAPEDRVGADTVEDEPIEEGLEEEEDEDEDEGEDEGEVEFEEEIDEDPEGASVAAVVPEGDLDDEEELLEEEDLLEEEILDDETSEEGLEEAEGVDAAARKKRKKKKRSDDDDVEDDEDGGNSAQIVRVTESEASIHVKKSRSSETVLTVDEGTELTFIKRSKKGGWFLVRDSSGDQGWILARMVSRPGFEYPRRLIRATARGGFSTLSQKFTSDGINYNISSPSIAVVVTGDLMYRYKTQYIVGAEVTYAGSRSSPGIRNTQITPPVDTSFTTHDVNVAGLFGYNFQNQMGMVAYGRLGYHYGYFGIDNVGDVMANPTGLPSEITQGITLGVRFEVPQFNEKIGFGGGASAILLAGSRKQTANLEDGALDSTRVIWANADFTYRWKPAFDIQAGYRLSYANSKWNGVANRGTGAMVGSSRNDRAHLVSVGIGRNF